LLPGLIPLNGVERVFIPPFISLSHVAPLLKDTPIGPGAQHTHRETPGAFMGETSAIMVKEHCG
jgi:triosephosphate isomerase